MGRTFPALCQFWTIVQEIIVVFDPATTRTTTTNKDHVPLAFVESRYQKMLHWMDTLVSDMMQENNKAAHVTFFQ